MAYCSQCGAELPPGARFCASCGTSIDAGAAPSGAADRPAGDGAGGTAPPLGAASRGGLGWVLPAMVIAALIAIGYLLLTPRGPRVETGTTYSTAEGAAPSGGGASGTGGEAAGAPTGMAPSAPSGMPTYVTAATLDSAFFSNPAAAAARYPAPLRVTGVIASMVQPGATPALSMEGRSPLNFMIVNFPVGYRERLAPLYKGQTISVTCDQVRALGGTTILSGCLLS